MYTGMMVGLLLVLAAGAMEGLFSLALTRTPLWSWEQTWGMGSLFALLILPWPLAVLTVPHLSAIYGTIPTSKLATVFLLGVGWGIGGIYWGKAIAAVGLALGVSLLMGCINIFGSLAPFAIYQRDRIFTGGGMLLLASVAVMVLGVGAIARAGQLKERDAKADSDPKPDFGRRPRFATGLFFCVLSGVLSALVNFSLVYGRELADAAERCGAPAWAKSFAIWAPVFTGNFLVNFLYAAALLTRRRSWGRLGEANAAHWCWALFMGVAWPAGIAVYGIAAFQLGPFGAYVGFPMMLICSILFGNLAGALGGEWRGTPRAAREWMGGGVAILIAALALMGWSNHLLER